MATKHASPLRAVTLLETVPEERVLQVGGQKFGTVREHTPNATRRSGEGRDLSPALRPDPTRTSVGHVADSAGSHTMERHSTERDASQTPRDFNIQSPPDASEVSSAIGGAAYGGILTGVGLPVASLPSS